MSEPTLYFVPYLDKDFDLRVMQPLRAQGYEIHSARDEKMLRASDPTQLAFAAQHKWTIVTFNRNDYLQLHTDYMNQGREHSGIVVSPKIEIGRLARLLINLLNQISADEMRNQFLYLQNYE